MRQSALLVTADGMRVLPESDEFFATLHRLVPRDDPLDFAVCNLGFIVFRPLDDGVMLIELDPKRADERALLRAERLVIESGGQLFRINRRDVVQGLGAALPPADAIAGLRALHAVPETSEPGERFAAAPRDLVKLLREPANPFCRLAQRWCASSGIFDESIISFVAENDLLPSLMVFDAAPAAAPVFRFIGDGHHWIAAEDRERLCGESVLNLPDPEYGGWASRTYRVVAESGEPRLDVVSANLFNQAGTSYAIRYDRLLLPWRTAGGQIRVTMVSRVFWRSGGGVIAPPTRH
jgi:hypothetical protein